MKPITLALFALLIACLSLPGCGLKIHPTVIVRLGAPAGRSTRVADIQSLSLYFVVIRGLPDTLSSAKVGQRSLTCLEWKGLIVSGNYDTAAGGFSATIPAGSYEAQFYGISGTGTTFEEIFAPTALAPKIYALSAPFRLNTANGSSQSVAATYPGVAVDLAPGCAPQTGGLPILAAYYGGSGIPNSATVTFETPASNPPKDYSGAVKTVASDPFTILAVPPDPGTGGQHVALDFMTTFPPNRAPSFDIAITFSGDQGTSLHGTNCHNFSPAPTAQFTAAVYNNNAQTWTKFNLTNTADGVSGLLEGLTAANYYFGGNILATIRSEAQVGLSTCAYLHLSTLNFRVIYQ